MPRNLEIAGLRCEFVGLLLFLIASIWQAQSAGWFDKSARESQGYIQEDVNIALLDAISELSKQIAAKTAAERRDAASRVYDRTSQAIRKAVMERIRRDNLDKGQGRVSGWIRFLLFFFGALLMLVGKYLVLRHKGASPPRPSQGAAD